MVRFRTKSKVTDRMKNTVVLCDYVYHKISTFSDWFVQISHLNVLCVIKTSKLHILIINNVTDKYYKLNKF